MSLAKLYCLVESLATKCHPDPGLQVEKECHIKKSVVTDNLLTVYVLIANIKTHGSVSCGPRSRRATREYINRKKENAIFTPM